MGKSVLESVEKDVYERVKMKLEFRDKVLAGLPKNVETLDWFLAQKMMSEEDQLEFKERVSAGKLTEEELAQIKSSNWCQFEKDKNGYLCLWHGNFKAMLREMLTTLGFSQKKPRMLKKNKDTGETEAGAAGGKQTFQHGVSVAPLRILFTRKGQPITEPDGYVDKIKHINDAAGRRSAIGRHDYLDQVELDVDLKWVDTGVFSADDFKKIMVVAQDDGLGACRSQGYGTFDVTYFEILSSKK